MGIDVDYVIADETLKKIKNKLDRTPHGKRKQIADKILRLYESLSREGTLHIIVIKS